MDLSSDTIWEIIKNIKWEDIYNICQINQQFNEVCRTPQAQELFHHLYNEYTERKGKELVINIEKLLDVFLTKDRLSIYNFLTTNEKNQRKQLATLLINNHLKKTSGTYPGSHTGRFRGMIGSGYLYPGADDPAEYEVLRDIHFNFLFTHPEIISRIQENL